MLNLNGTPVGYYATSLINHFNCKKCGAVVNRGMLELHSRWHYGKGDVVPVEELGLPVRVYAIFKREGLHSLEDIIYAMNTYLHDPKTWIYSFKGVGPNLAQKTIQALREYGLDI